MNINSFVRDNLIKRIVKLILTLKTEEKLLYGDMRSMRQILYGVLLSFEILLLSTFGTDEIKFHGYQVVITEDNSKYVLMSYTRS